MLKRWMSQALPERGRAPRGLFGAPIGGAGVEAGGGAGVEASRGVAPSAAWWLWLSGMPSAVEHGPSTVERGPSAVEREPRASRGGRQP